MLVNEELISAPDASGNKRDISTFYLILILMQILYTSSASIIPSKYCKIFTT